MLAYAFTIHNGSFYLGKNFDQVLKSVVNFLTTNPSKTVLMRIKQEHEPEANTRSFSDTFRFYYSQYKDFFWQNNNYNPSLGEVRRKIVVLQNFEGDSFGLSYSSFDIQDDYNVNSFDSKKQSILNYLTKTDSNRGVINYLSGANSGIQIIIFSPSKVATETSKFLIEYVDNYSPSYVGIIPADFPSESLINSIIYVNGQHLNNNQKYEYTPVYRGGFGGVAFEDSKPTTNIKHVLLRSGSFLDQIQLSYEDGKITEAHGGNGGEFHVYTIPTNECITKIELRTGSAVDSITFITNTGKRSSTYGGSGGGLRQISFSNNGCLVGLKGRAGSRIDAIGFISMPRQ